MKRRTVIVEGPLAFHMRRVDAARRGEAGVQIMTFPLLAARLAGGFIRPARSEDLFPAVRSALQEGGFAGLESVRHLPGMTRAVARSLGKIWESDLELAHLAAGSHRLADIAEIERRVRASLPAGVLTPRDLRDAALRRVAQAPTVLGSIELQDIFWVAPVWRPLLRSLYERVPTSWHNPGCTDAGWFPGDVVAEKPASVPAVSVVTCANPRAEAVEALRWVRELISSGQARPEEIAICATATEQWDEHFLVLSSDAELPLHFTHGLPALASREGQACAALADCLLNGLSQDRVRRLFAHSAGRSRALGGLPPTWSAGLQSGAALFDVVQWGHALERATDRRGGGYDPRPVVLPVLELLSRGADAAEEAGELLLGPEARPLWTQALRSAPPKALEFTLQELRLPDRRDAGASAVWCPASHLVGAPRPWVRLLGMTSRSWPRRAAEDPIVPGHVLPRRELDPYPVVERDRRAFAVIASGAAGGCVLSRALRNAQGGLLSASPLIPKGTRAQFFKRARIPQHAFNESDRLLARPHEAAKLPAVTAAGLCWRNWREPAVTGHDGIVRADHPVIARAVDEVQSATSLKLLLRNPLGFVWRYALGWSAPAGEDQPLALDARAYGELVHELLKRAVDALEPSPGYARATREEIGASLASAVRTLDTDWPLQRSVPPAMLWRHTLDNAAGLALKALTLDTIEQPDTRSWTEVAFGEAGVAEERDTDLPWPSGAEVLIPGTSMRVRGRIDRLDLRGDGRAVRVSDYKTGAEPGRAQEILLGGGSELQRVIYALAARQLLPDEPRVVARLVYLGDRQPRPYRLPDIGLAIADLAADVTAAVALLRRGTALPGPDAQEERSDFRLAMPASLATYFRIKNAAISRAFGDFCRVWSRR
ncbi:PD-(D/E)XK nuclease family protein [Bradyrhizobium sp. BRP14]|nr:PD-(D/E)XK nuclease family protein [Bradyrhizobium sp. BRP14]